MIILGIDPGTAKMGWGVIKNIKYQRSNIKDESGRNKEPKQQTELIGYGCFVTPVGELPEKRLLSLYKELKRKVKEFPPEVIVLERIFFNTNAKTAIAVGQARGVVMLVAAEAKVPLVEYTALQAKLILTGYGRAEKKAVQREVKKRLGCREKIKPDDAADALAIALCHVIKFG